MRVVAEVSLAVRSRSAGSLSSLIRSMSGMDGPYSSAWVMLGAGRLVSTAIKAE